jgi:NAD(P)-dependent dehydrogenase (short-subunit alcohol dehydrogenase family)
MSARGDCEGDAIVLAGATGRVGAATLTTLVREGARVVVLSRDETRARATISGALEPALRERAIALQTDLTVPADADRAVAFALEKFGRVDAVVNLAGSGVGWGPISESSLDELHATVQAFLDTAYTLSMAALRAMLAQPYREGARSRGRIVTVTAGSSKAPAEGRALFGAVKAAVNTLMLGVARDHKADGIVANALVLGGVGFAGAEKFYSPEDFRAAATPQEVAEVLAFLAADRSSGINGALVDLNAREVD